MEQAEALEELKPVGLSSFWGFWATTGFGAITIIVSFIVQALTLVVFVINYLISRKSGLDVAVTGVQSNLGSVITAALVLQVLVCLPVIISFVKLRGKLSFRDYVGLQPFKARTLLVWLPANLAYLVLAQVVRNVFNIPESQSDMTLYNTSQSLPLFFVAIVVFAPIFEEVLFRGFIFQGYLKSIGPVLAIILTSGMWALLHISPEVVIYDVGVIFIGGLLLGMARWKTGSLWMSLTMHAFWNTLAFLSIALSNAS